MTAPTPGALHADVERMLDAAGLLDVARATIASALAAARAAGRAEALAEVDAAIIAAVPDGTWGAIFRGGSVVAAPVKWTFTHGHGPTPTAAILAAAAALDAEEGNDGV